MSKRDVHDRFWLPAARVLLLGACAEDGFQTTADTGGAVKWDGGGYTPDPGSGLQGRVFFIFKGRRKR